MSDRACMSGWEALEDDPLPWLLDDQQPNLVGRVLVELVGRPAGSQAVRRALGRSALSQPVAELLRDLHPDGSWSTTSSSWSRFAGPGWRIVAAVQYGADSADPRLHAGALGLIEEQIEDGGFRTRHGAAADPLLTARAAHALVSLGWARHARVQEALAWLDEAAPAGDDGGWRNARGTECAVTAAAVLSACAVGDGPRRGGLVDRAADAASRLLASGAVSARWGHPRLGRTDTLELLAGLVRLGSPYDETLRQDLVQLQRGQDARGRWHARQPAPRTLPLGAPVDAGEPCGWLTLQAITVLMAWAVPAGLPRRYPQRARSRRAAGDS